MNSKSRDTAAWYVIEQVLKHSWGASEDMDDREILAVCKLFWKSGGVWQKLMEGDSHHIGILDECVGNVIASRSLMNIASRIAKMPGNV